MRIQSIQVKYYYQAKKKAQWASKIVKVCGGYIAFESIKDYEIWKGQI